MVEVKTSLFALGVCSEQHRILFQDYVDLLCRFYRPIICFSNREANRVANNFEQNFCWSSFLASVVSCP
ncbi:hypothetical protein RHMOL_Rhmol04G0016300 [Rhododendron molle]|uniref:Uncharacterized protein n=2 Tax=Rhododendron molle TaxID=49168 RepID=A0ACC0NX88_RHOML|nr:hypothetical protein RHMOL_Rhmol04G0016300 [Rhododendron molle]KAI8557512.1 hypothetical protein RHMOL_Rhmol04G0016300 [Rhododendron molle]